MQSFLVVNSWFNQCALCVAERCFKLRWSWILSVRSLSLDIIVRKWRKNAILNWWWCWAKCALLTADAHDTLKYLIKEHACLLFLEFLPSLLGLFHVINKTFAPLFTFFHVINKRICPPCSFIPSCSFIRYLRVVELQYNTLIQIMRLVIRETKKKMVSNLKLCHGHDFYFICHLTSLVMYLKTTQPKLQSSSTSLLLSSAC